MEDFEPLRGYDSYVVTLGDVLRGERITLNKTVEQAAADLRIKPSYVLAIENGDLSEFELPVLVGGLVRSYARYLGLDPEVTYVKFCQETGFSHQVADPFAVKDLKLPERDLQPEGRKVPSSRDSLVNRSTLSLGFIRPRQFWQDFSVSAVFNMGVLVMIIAGLAYGGWNVVREIQQVRMVPSDETRLANGDLITSLWLSTAEDGNSASGLGEEVAGNTDPGSVQHPDATGLGRSYRPQILDYPVVEPRDGPIASIDPDSFGTLIETDDHAIAIPAEAPQVVEKAPPIVEVYAANPAWLRVFVEAGDVLFEEILDAKQIYQVPQDVENPLLRSGNSGSVYLVVDGKTYGPVGSGTGVAKRVSLNAADIIENFEMSHVAVDRNRQTVADGNTVRPVLPRSQ
ncbi:MAG: DUF4115 domain-containing protein [Rhodobacteraceae bacterium]|nr:DUF4115 domain-containing protein [Paracoccaceae bacterium]MCY4140908.1 DUF4115 domain-containing protein [Paracoccaceae bacterium]